MFDLLSIVSLCAPHVAPDTMLSIIKTESANNPLVINDNTNKTAYRPRNKDEAIILSVLLIKKGHNLDFGLTQVNLTNAKKYHMTLNNLFDPCENVRAGARILTENFAATLKTSRNEQIALLKAVSMYNTGSTHAGFRNGYVARVIGNSKRIILPPAYSNNEIK